MTAAIRPTHIRIPLINIKFELTARDKKVIAVALATLALFGLQMGVSLAVTLGTAFLFSTLTYLSEKYLRTEQNDWFDTKFDKKEMIFWTALLILRPFIIQIVCLALGVPLPILPQVELVQNLLARPWVMIPLATIVAPIAEEILFRGFLLERLEDITQHQAISNGVQAVIFGAVHLNQKIKEGWETSIFFMLSFMGYLYGRIKQADRSLISPVTLHSANNIGAVIQVFTAH